MDIHDGQVVGVVDSMSLFPLELTIALSEGAESVTLQDTVTDDDPNPGEEAEKVIGSGFGVQVTRPVEIGEMLADTYDAPRIEIIAAPIRIWGRKGLKAASNLVCHCSEGWFFKACVGNSVCFVSADCLSTPLDICFPDFNFTTQYARFERPLQPQAFATVRG